MCRSVDEIYHCATSMNHLETYQAAKRINVDGTSQVLKLAASINPKVVHYVSTLGVFSPFGGSKCRVVDEETGIDDERHPMSRGDVASKWVGEKLVLLASQRGIPCNIYRLGLVW